MVATEPDKLEIGCGGCRPDRCFNHRKTLVVKAQRVPTLTLNKSNWWQVTEACRTAFNNPDWTELAALLYYGICRRSLITLESLELLHLYRVTGGIRANTPADYYRLPALWCNVVAVIEDELMRVRKQRNG